MNIELLSALEDGATVLTVNRRLARSIRLAYDQRQASRGRRAWPTAPVYTLGEWVRRQWAQLSADRGDVGVVPESEQERVLWETIVADSEDGAKLLQLAGTAALARDAWSIAVEWRIPLTERADGMDHDFTAFLGWAARYRELLSGHGWQDPAALPDVVAAAVRSGELPAPRHVVLAGFDDLTPQQRDLLDELRAAGAEVDIAGPPAERAVPVCVELEDHAEEIASAARWARNLLDGGARGPIGVLVPDIGRERARVESTFTDYLQPSRVLPGAGEGPRAFNISIGRPLSDAPVIAAALVALDLCAGPVAIDRVGLLLRSPFIEGGVEELSERCVFDARLRRRGYYEVALATLTGEGLSARDQPPPLLASSAGRVRDRVRRALGASGAEAVARPPSYWAGALVELLDAFGWPRGRPPVPAEQHAVERWWELLASYATLDPVLPGETLELAVKRIRRMADETLTQPASDEAPVQVLGLLEAGGLAFEHLWIMGMHDEILPASPSPNPFIPLAVQRRLGVSRSSAERELAFARLLFDGLLASSPEVIVSWPAADGERRLRPSPLLEGFRCVTPAELPLEVSDLFERVVHRSAAIETVLDEQGPPTSGAVSGGTWMIKDQALCPFKAFVTHRLQTRRIESPRPGLDPRGRGTVVHAALERVWDELVTQDALLRLEPEELRRLVERCVVEALDAVAAESPEALRPRYRELEHARLVRLVLSWLEVERERAPFTVEQREGSSSIPLGGLSINVRIDRVDRLADGRRVFIDYKTSSPSHAKWMGDRPEEPQLPIYCTTRDDVAAVLFAKVRAAEQRFVGLAADEGIVPMIRAFKGSPQAETWEALMDSWRTVLNQTANRFTQGDARVDPKSVQSACRYCDLDVLCRLAEVPEVDEEEVSDGRE